MKLLTLACAIGFAALAARPAEALVIFSTDPVAGEAAFFAANSGAGFESFESHVVANALNASSIAAADFTVTAGVNQLGIHTNNVLGSVATDGTKYLRAAPGAGGGTITFTFDFPIIAFGVTTTDPLDGGANPRLDLATNGGLNVPSILSGLQVSGTTLFIGFTADTPFTALTLINRNSVADGIGFDEVRYVAASTVPEPGTLALVAAALLTLGMKRRR